MFQKQKIIIGAKFKKICVKVWVTQSFQQANKRVFLEKQFYAILFYLTLKIFKKYSKEK